MKDSNHQKLGIAAFIFSLFPLFFLVSQIPDAWFGKLLNFNIYYTILVHLFAIVAPILTVGFATFSLMSPGKKKTFAIIGIINLCVYVAFFSFLMANIS